MASSAPKGLSPRAREIVDVALELLEEEGPDGLSMRGWPSVSASARRRSTSICRTSRRSRRRSSRPASSAQAAAFEAGARRISEDPLGAIARAYRDFAKAHPHLYRLMTERELNRDLLTPGVEDRAAPPLYEAVGRDRDLARAAWAFAHGMTILELDQRFPAGRRPRRGLAPGTAGVPD